jgi:hypothetical protein
MQDPFRQEACEEDHSFVKSTIMYPFQTHSIKFESPKKPQADDQAEKKKQEMELSKKKDNEPVFKPDPKVRYSLLTICY